MFTFTISKSLHSVNFLYSRFALLSMVATPGRYRRSLPSWVPDYSSFRDFSPELYPKSKIISASSTIEANIMTNGQNAVILGAVVNVKLTATNPLSDLSPRTEWQEWLQECRTTAKKEATFYDKGSFEDHWWRLLICDMYQNNGSRTASQGFGDYYLSPEVVSIIWKKNGHQTIESTRNEAQFEAVQAVFEYTFLRYNASADFCVTEKGLFGWVNPDCIEIGDKVCLLAGATTPFMMRERQDGSYHIIGLAYIHGIMYEEAVKWEGLEWKPLHIR
jgi:hypothetical protein